MAVYAKSFLIFLLRAVVAGGITALCVYRGKHPVKRSKAEKMFLRGVGIVGLCFVLFMGAWLFSAMYSFTSKSRVSSINSSARLVYNAYQTALADLDKQCKLPAHCKEIITGEPDGSYEPDTVEYLMQQKYFTDSRMYYVIVTDGNWNVRYTLCSKKPITPDEIRPYRLESQRKYMENPFKDHAALVGYYPVPERDHTA